MAFKDFVPQSNGIELLQRSLERRRLAHAYLFSGDALPQLEALGLALVKTLNCLNPVKRGGIAVDCCEQCRSCLKIEHLNHPDVQWVRPESKSRVITVEQMRELMHQVNLKPTEAEFKAAVIVAADRLNAAAANAFLKTLEEPPAKSVFILLTTEPQRLLETIVSRCLRLNFGGEGAQPLDPETMSWLARFCDMAGAPQKSMLGRYRLLDVLLDKLTQIKSSIEEALTARSPLQRYPDVEKSLQEKWEDELKAAIEAEYRRQRAELLLLLQRWFRDIWLRTITTGERQTTGAAAKKEGSTVLLNFPSLQGSGQVATRLSSAQAVENLQVLEQLQRWLNTNVQEALALEVGFLKLKL